MQFFLLDHFSRHPWGCVEALKPFLGPFFPRKLLINMLVTLIGENSASESIVSRQKLVVTGLNETIQIHDGVVTELALLKTSHEELRQTIS